MKKWMTALFLFPLMAGASDIEGSFSCKNVDGLPNNLYEIKQVSVDGVKVPYVQIHRTFRREPGRPESPMESVDVSGFATVSQSARATVMLVAAIRLEFVDGKLFGCQQ